ncbi:MAG: DEAD/DEAH box helicase [Planctomycetes bacterium]|nr:DEAD/DEAH box helicase [Planctomycetota bacterium]MCB9892115.1 DEAD/DEAH box helicase [Planctomycetota bacterium]
MSHVLELTPTGNLSLRAAPDEQPKLPKAYADGLREALRRGVGHGLLYLVSEDLTREVPPGLAYWRSFAREYMVRRCHVGVPDGDQDWIALETPSDERLDKIVLKAPPGRGMEYLRRFVLIVLWDAIDEALFDLYESYEGEASTFLSALNPVWQMVGRVTLHIAENPRDRQRPFAFLATYTHGLSRQVELHHIPLMKALREYGGDENRSALANLLAPIEKAAESSSIVRELVQSRHLFQPLAWVPAKAFRFIQDIPIMEASGVVVSVPKWWENMRPQRPKVALALGERSASVGAEGILDLSVQVVLDGEALSQTQVKEVLKQRENLARVKGRWVEVDAGHLAEGLKHWGRAERQFRGAGVPFLKGMRILAGVRGEIPMGKDPDGRGWIDIIAGKQLRAAMDRIQEAREEAEVDPGASLRATLRLYQKKGLNWLWVLHQYGLGACLADDMGLGKTLQTIALLLLVKQHAEEPLPASLLIIPTSLLGNWKAELKRFAPTLEVLFVHPSEGQSIGDGDDEVLEFDRYDLVITSYGMLKTSEELLNHPWNLAILDEGQTIRNPRTQLARAAKAVHSRSRVVLSGTPIENRLMDLWSMFDFLCPGLLGTESEFKGMLKGFEDGEGLDYAPLRKLVAPYILRRLKTDETIIKDLPEKIELRVFCTLTADQATLYQESVEELQHTLRTHPEGIERKGVVLAFLTRFKQLCNHPSQWYGDGAYEAEESGKFQRLVEICEELASRQEKALIFTQYREMTKPLHALLQPVFGSAGLILHGGTSAKKRQEYVDTFQSPDGPPFFILSLKAGGVGLNLTEAGHVIHFDRWWNPAVENQATDRVFRIGQQKNVMVHKFVCQGTIEERIDQMIEDKKSLAEEILSKGAEGILTEMDDEHLLNFVALDRRAATRVTTS